MSQPESKAPSSSTTAADRDREWLMQSFMRLLLDKAPASAEREEKISDADDEDWDPWHGVPAEVRAAKYYSRTLELFVSGARLLKLVRQIVGVSGRATRPLNVLVFGVPSAGKSSFVNAMLTACHPDPNKRVCDEAKTRVPAKGGHVTKTISSYQLHNTNVVGWDAVGQDKDNYSSAKIGEIMEGHWKHGAPLNANRRDSTYYRKNPTLDDKMHAVILVVPADVVNEKDDWAEPLREVREVADEKEIPVVVLVSKIDKIDERLVYRPDKAFHSAAVDMVVDKVNDVLNVGGRHVHRWLHHRTSDRNPFVESLTLEAVADAAELADGFYMASKQDAASEVEGVFKPLVPSTDS